MSAGRSVKKIELLNEEEWEYRVTPDIPSEWDGLTSAKDKVILIKPKQSKRNLADTLLHETLHATTPLDEETVTAVAPVLVRVLEKFGLLLNRKLT